jgi:DNA-binding NarL/FixJ family response regulator
MLNEVRESAIHILLVDDHPVVRMGYVTLLKRINSAFVFHEAGCRQEALDLLARHTPKVALLDLNLTDAVELSLVGEVRTQAPAMPILVVSMHDERLYAERVLRAGAKGYVMKNHAAQSIARAVQTVLEGKVWLSEQMRNALMSKLLNPSELGQWERFALLSNRELEVFRLLGIGLKKAEIASRLGLSANTVETYRANIKQKLGIATGAELYRVAFLQFRNDGMTGMCRTDLADSQSG